MCIVMFACLIWRSRRRRRKIKDSAVELRLRRNLITEELTRGVAAKVGERMWVRATARWKASAKQAARRRRGPRLSVISRQALSTLDRELRRHSTSSLQLPTPSSSELDDSQLTSTFDSESVPGQLLPTSRASMSSRLTPQSPPAYIHQNLSVGEFSLETPEIDASTNSEHVSFAAAHIATDDKAVLARLEQLATAPPLPDDAIESHPGQSSSAPALFEDGTDDYTNTSESGFSSFTSLLPPPPPVRKDLTLDYASTPFDDVYQAGPSAPPFEDHVASVGLVPSAPVMEFDDEESQCASSPPMDDSELEDQTIKLTLPGYQP